jgi:phosphate starvation-inducible PhoH-like protein
MSRRKNRAVVESALTSTHRRNDYQESYQQQDNTINFNTYLKKKKNVALIPKTYNQGVLIDYLQDENKHIVFATGPAGSGKTYLTMLAGVKALKEGLVSKLVLTRPAVGVDDEKHGFLPGSMDEKMMPWCRPLFDILQQYYNSQEISHMLSEGIIELSPLAFMRGRSFVDSFIIFDEAQNSTVNQMKMVLTRVGEGCKLVITGDLAQHDRKYQGDNGFRDFMDRLKQRDCDLIAVAEFDRFDIQRHKVVKAVLEIYGEE